MRKLVVVAILAAVAALVVSTGALAKGQHKGGPKDHELKEWTIPAGQCGLLPAGLELNGVGTSKVKDKVKTRRNGVMHEDFREIVKGTATDNWGNHYRFYYVQTFKGSSPGTGLIKDHFDLSGDGPANLLSEFTVDFTFGADWVWTSDPVFTVISGDPEHCDPI